MQKRLSLLLTALTLPAFAFNAPPADKLAFGPAAGTTLSRAWTITNEASLDDMQVSVGGKPQPMPGEMEMTQTMKTEITVSDKLVELGAGAPKVLVRTYEKLAGDGSVAMVMGPMGENSTDMSAKSELEGKKVKFTWNADGGKFERDYDESEGDKELLEGLVEDMDLREFLPKTEVSAGDTWKIAPAAMRAMVAPGGALALIPESAEGGMGGMSPGMDQMGDLAGMLTGDFEGEVTAEYKGIREDSKLGEIKITFEIKTSADLSEKAAELADQMPEGMSMEIQSLDMEFSWKGEATILWDVASGHVSGVEAAGDQSLSVDTGMKMSMQGQEMEIETGMEMSGKVESKLVVTRE
jgi:dsDNA-binding SOS-regulon protein